MEDEKAEPAVPSGVVVDEKEEEKVEQFFALIRSFHEARNRRKNELEERQKKTKKMKMSNEQEQSSWVPSFEWEDFTQEIEFRKPPLIFPGPDKKREEEKKQEDGDGLDLKLAL